MREQFWKYIFSESNFENVFFEGAISKVYFLGKQFQKCTFWDGTFENAFFEGAILKESDEE